MPTDLRRAKVVAGVLIAVACSDQDTDSSRSAPYDRGWGAYFDEVAHPFRAKASGLERGS